jgi:hypothetical protein
MHKLRMHKFICGQSPLLRIGRDVTKLILKILGVANAVFMESGLPDLAAELSAQAVRKTVLDALDAALDGLIRGRAEKNMQMLRHDHEPMKEIAALVSIVE